MYLDFRDLLLSPLLEREREFLGDLDRWFLEDLSRDFDLERERDLRDFDFDLDLLPPRDLERERRDLLPAAGDLERRLPPPLFTGDLERDFFCCCCCCSCCCCTTTGNVDLTTSRGLEFLSACSGETERFFFLPSAILISLAWRREIATTASLCNVQKICIFANWFLNFYQTYGFCLIGMRGMAFSAGGESSRSILMSTESFTEFLLGDLELDLRLRLERSLWRSLDLLRLLLLKKNICYLLIFLSFTLYFFIN